MLLSRYFRYCFERGLKSHAVFRDDGGSNVTQPDRKKRISLLRQIFRKCHSGPSMAVITLRLPCAGICGLTAINSCTPFISDEVQRFAGSRDLNLMSRVYLVQAFGS